MLKESLGKGFDPVSIFKPNAPLANIVETWGSLVKILPSRLLLL
jgi:hypothetical protein